MFKMKWFGWQRPRLSHYCFHHSFHRYTERKIARLKTSDLHSSNEKGNTDGDIIMNKIKVFLDTKEIPVEQRNIILSTLEKSLLKKSNERQNGEKSNQKDFDQNCK